ncbi:terminase small subunit [Microbacterium phage Cen1621]|uniref:Terminase small subunit n=1 Tax=Microbacterium phage Cen1621 TaxID=2965191 RepID=A0A9E7TXJ6_9CAUD|nr:terminase small subunit [Microbacterium phage Cen1621]
MPGPLPKENRQRERDTRRRAGEFTHVEADGELRGPELVGNYSPATLAWYDVWRRSPQAALFESTDWLRLALLAPMVERHLESPSAAAMSEIRMNEERLGATYADRLRARIAIDRPDEGGVKLAPVTELKPKDIAARLAAARAAQNAPEEDAEADEPAF